jgi:outer membrane lipoprotein-sorting protein
MMKRATAVLVLLALCGLLPAAAQEPQEEMAAEAKKMAEEAEGMVEEAEGMAEEAAGMAEEAKKMMAGDGRSLDEVLASHYEALGGTDAWAAVESVRFEGTMSMGPGMEAPFKMTMKRPDQIRLEFSFQGMTGIQASDGTTAWMVMPFMGKVDPEEMPADMANQLKEQADIDGPLFDWADKSHTVELLGVEEMEGTEVYKIQLTLDSGDVRYHYLDTEYHVTVKQEGKTKVQGQEMDIETSIGDYKEICLATSTVVDEATPCEGDALVMAYSIESKPKGAPSGQAITIESVALNPDDIEADYFAMPVKEADEADEAESGG